MLRASSGELGPVLAESVKPQPTFLNAHVTPFPEASKTRLSHTRFCCRHRHVAPTLGFLQRRWRARAARPCWTNQGGGSQRAISVDGGGCTTGRVAQLNCRRGASAADASRPDQAARASSLASDASAAGNELVATTTFACRPGQLRSPAGERRHISCFVSRCGCR